MRSESLSEAAIAAFRHSYADLVSGSSGNILETEINAVAHLPDLDTDIRGKQVFDTSLLQQTLVLKLNGGLGTSMGLDKAKSLLEVKGGNTFLDLTAKQVISMRQHFKANVSFMLMNSFNTSEDTLNFLSKYPTLANDVNLELMQVITHTHSFSLSHTLFLSLTLTHSLSHSTHTHTHTHTHILFLFH